MMLLESSSLVKRFRVSGEALVNVAVMFVQRELWAVELESEIRIGR
jgi:hypothetical protein